MKAGAIASLVVALVAPVAGFTLSSPSVSITTVSRCPQLHSGFPLSGRNGKRIPLALRSMDRADTDSPQWDEETDSSVGSQPEARSELKRKLLLAAGLCDRGFSASMKERDEITRLINELETLSPLESPSAGIDGDGPVEVPLKGVWRLVYTSAIDVLNLWASPIASIGPIYQDISNPPVVVNVIDQSPRALSLLPPSKELESVLRLKVFTRARERGPARVGLAFETVKVEPKNLIGRDVSFLPSPSVDLPRIPIFGGGDDSPAYFDILYLDPDLLIIRQNSVPGADGGIFVSTKVDPAAEPVPL